MALNNDELIEQLRTRPNPQWEAKTNRHGRCKLSANDVQMVKTLHKQGYTYTFIAKICGVSCMTIARTVKE